MAFLDTLGAEIKASFKRIPFSSVGGGGYQANNALVNWNGSMTGNRQPGATLNYDELAGDPLDNRVVAACIEAISSALPEAPPILEKRKGDDWERIPDHPVLDLLHRPNAYHTPYHLWNATIGSELTAADGSAYWQVVMNEAGSAPAELWFEPRVKVLWNAKEFISGYQLERDGKWVDVKNDQIIHFRNSLNPYNTRLGRNALAAGKRQITGDNAAATYHSALLLNSAVASLLVTLKDGGTTTLTPEQLNDYMEKLTNKLRGEGAGKIAGSNLPVDVHKLAYSPDEMSIDKIISYYEITLCALMKVPPRVIQFGGTDNATHDNLEQSIRDLWQRTIIPAQNRRGLELTTQLLPLFGLDASQHRISFDYSNVAALTEDDNPLMDVLVKVCGGAFMTKNEARSRLKMEPLPEGGDEVGTPPPVAPPTPDASQAPPKVEAKSYNPRQPRDDHGKWNDGAGGISQGHAAHVMRSEGISDKDAAGVLSAIQDGTHTTREHVLAHIDSIHASGKSSTQPPTINSVSHAAEVLSNLGVQKVDLPDSQHMAQMAVTAVHQIKAAGLPVPSSIVKMKKGERVVAYADDNNRIGLSTSPMFTQEVLEHQVKTKWWSQSNPILHEVGHLHHKERLRTATRHVPVRQFAIGEGHKKIAATVSGYAARNPMELVAEVFAGHLSGVKYSDDVLKVYAFYEGPELK